MQNTLTIASRDEKTGSVEFFKFSHTNHSLLRSAQRGISNYKLSVALLYGQPFYKQGLIYYVLGENNIPIALQKFKEILRNTIVIVDGKSDTIITCYRSKDPFNYIKRKSNILK